MTPQEIICTLPGYDPYRDADGCEFLPERAAPYIALCETHLTHIEGKVAGQPYILQEHELAIVLNIFGWYSITTGLRRYSEAFYFVPRKNSKSTFGACLSNMFLFCEAEPRMQNYSLGADREQASIIRNIATAQIEANPELADRVKIYKTTRAVELLSDGSIYRALTADARTKHGLNAHLVLADEIHAYPNSELIDVMKTSQGARTQPFVMYTTTADYVRESVCNSVYDYACKVRDGAIKDPTYLPIIYEVPGEMVKADPDCWKRPEVWAIANPMLGKSVSVEFLEKECRRACAEPSYENTFKRLYLNIQTETSERMISSEAWERNNGAHPVDAFQGREVAGAALDVGATSDMCSLCLLFDRDEGGYDALWWHWIPREAADTYERKRQIPYSVWSQDGWVNILPGNEIDYAQILAEINDIGTQYRIKELAVDRLFQGAQLCQNLTEEGWEVTAFACSFYHLTAPTAELLRLINRGEFRHGDSPVMRWQASNAILTRNAQDNMKPGKAESAAKIDGIVSGTMALAMAMQAKEAKPKTYKGKAMRFL